MIKSFFCFLCLICLLAKSFDGTGAIIPSVNPGIIHHSLNPHDELFRKIASLSPRQFELATGRHLNFKERLGYRLLQWKLRWQLNHPGKHDYNATAEKQAKLSLYMGVGAWVFPIVAAIGAPIIGFFSIPLAIAAIILGGISVNKVQHKSKAIWGIILGVSFLILLIIIVAILSSAIFI